MLLELCREDMVSPSDKVKNVQVFIITTSTNHTYEKSGKINAFIYSRYHNTHTNVCAQIQDAFETQLQHTNSQVVKIHSG